MSTYEGLTLTESLTEGAEPRAITVLQKYYTPLSSEDVGFTGGAFDTFDPTGSRSSAVNTFTAEDLVSVSLLSVRVPGRAAVEILDRQRRRFEQLLDEIGPDRDLVEVDSVNPPDFPAWKLWRALSALPKLGPTTVSKLMARKRPRLIPVFDSVINQHVLGGTGIQWKPLHDALRADGGQLHTRLVELRTAAGLNKGVSPLRVFDVLAWMDGTGWADKATSGEPIEQQIVAHEDLE